MKRRRLWFVALFAVGALFAAPMATAGAATQTQSTTVDVKGSTAPLTVLDTGTPDVTTGAGICDSCIPDDLSPLSGATGVGGQLSGSLTVKWTNPVQIDTTYNDALLRQGETLDTSDTATVQTGTVTVTAQLNAFIAVYQDPDGIDSDLSDGDQSPQPWALYGYLFNGTLTQDLGTFNCSIPLPGESPRNCPAASKEITLLSLPVFPPFVSLDLRAALTLSMDASGTAITSLRTLETTTGDSLGSDRTLEFTPTSPATVADPVVVPCSVPAGSDLLYGLTDQTYTADPINFNLTAALNFVVDLPWPIPDPVVTLFSHTYTEVFPPLNATANDIVHDLGPIQADNRPPVIGTVNAPNGTEGTPIHFGVFATDNCGMPTVRWDFSDGGVAFGLSPFHTFSDNGTYSGLITATDQTGNTATQTFSVIVDNVDPMVSGGPDKSTPWGVPVSFHANGSDPGSIDNAILLYAWDFADPNSPIGGSGQNTSHTYSMPGVYNAQVIVNDKDTGSGTDQVQVTVGKRATTTAYTGPLSALPSKNLTLKASVIDQYGQPVVGRTVAFTLGTQSISAATDAAGNASATIKLNQKKGSYTVSASFAGDGLYLISSDSRSFTIG